MIHTSNHTPIVGDPQKRIQNISPGSCGESRRRLDFRWFFAWKSPLWITRSWIFGYEIHILYNRWVHSSPWITHDTSIYIHHPFLSVLGDFHLKSPWITQPSCENPTGNAFHQGFCVYWLRRDSLAQRFIVVKKPRFNVTLLEIMAISEFPTAPVAVGKLLMIISWVGHVAPPTIGTRHDVWATASRLLPSTSM